MHNASIFRLTGVYLFIPFPMQVVQLRHTSAVEHALKERVLDKISRPPLVVNCRNALITRFLDELSAIKRKRPAAALQEVGEEGDIEEEDESKEEKKPLVLQPPPLGRERSSSAPEEPSTKSQTEEEKPTPIMTRSASMKAKKSVSFSPVPSFDDDQGSVNSSLNDVGKDKRRKRLLRKQETVEEQEAQNDKALLEVDSSTAGPFGHQRGATVRPGKKISRRFEKFRAAAATVIAERKLSGGTSSTASSKIHSKEESKSPAIIESHGERFEMEVFIADDLKTGTVSDRKESQTSLTPPIAKPESVTISLSPSDSPLRRSPVQDTEDRYPDILEAITPLPPVPPVKFSAQPDEKHDSNSVNARNGSVAPEVSRTVDYDVERAQRLSRTRWWQKVNPSFEITSTEENSERLHISVFDESEIQRETNV